MSYYSLGIDIGSTTVKIAILDEGNNLLFSDYLRHYADIQGTLTTLLKEAQDMLGDIKAAEAKAKEEKEQKEREQRRMVARAHLQRQQDVESLFIN